jgi:hypothetical protein
MRTICASSVSRPTRFASMTTVPVPLTVPAVTRLPGPFSTGIGSPVTIDSSIDVRPFSTTPSTGTFSPGRTRSLSPTRTSAIGMSFSINPITLRAVFGASPRSPFNADDVRLRARSSST